MANFEFHPKRTRKDGPESIIQSNIKKMLMLKGWFVLETHGNMYQWGFPDIFTTHSRYGQRWVEVKNPKHYSFTPAQIEIFPKLVANGSGVWILVADSEEEYQKLFKPPNWYWYLPVMR